MYTFEAIEKEIKDDLLHKEIFVVAPEQRRTSEKMTLGEYTSVIATRAKHLENGAMPFINTTDHDYAKIAEAEILAKKCPFYIRRIMSNGLFMEIWDVNEMIIPFK